MDKGVYCLVLECKEPCTINVGAVGEIFFERGWYIYVGSALGPGGLSRVSRHIKFFHERYRRPKWHIDHLMISENIFLRYTVCGKTFEKLECLLAKKIGRVCVKNFGCSDCECDSHLFFREENPFDEICDVFEMLNLSAEKYFLS